MVLLFLHGLGGGSCPVMSFHLTDLHLYTGDDRTFGIGKTHVDPPPTGMGIRPGC